MRPHALALLLATGCASAPPPASPAPDATTVDTSGADTTTDTASPSADTTPDVPAPACPPAATWAPGTPAFAEATEAWGLTGVKGLRMNLLDVDGDGWVDLLVRDGGGENAFSKGGPRDTWLMRNTGKGFVDVTEASGLLRRRLDPAAPTGLSATAFAAGDVDNDGDEDLFLGRSTAASDPKAETSELLLNDGKGQFELGPADSAARFAGQASVPLSASFVDFDKDGKLDLWVVHNMPGGANQPLQDRLLKGDGTGRFQDVTVAAGLKTVPWQSISLLNQAKGHSWAWAATACDLNNDGLEELMAASYGRAPNHLWRAEKAGDEVKFVNESVASGYAFDERTDWRDNQSARCHCADVPTDAECNTCPKPDPQICAGLKAAFGPNYRWNHAGDREPWRLGGNSGTTVCADVNNDGWFDLLTTEIVHWDVGSSSDPSELLLNTQAGEVRMQRVGNDTTGLVRIDASGFWDHGDITAALYDFDNDGWLDVHIAASDYPANRALLFRQDAPAHFQELDPKDFFLRMRAAGVLAADFDHDGDVDVITGHTRMRCEGAMGADCQPDDQIHLHLNQLGGRWLALDLRGQGGSNRSAIGARAWVTAGGVTQTAYVDGGHGQSSTQRDHVLHFGLGQACEAKVQVRWPDSTQTTQTFTLQAGKRWRIVQGQAPVELP